MQFNVRPIHQLPKPLGLPLMLFIPSCNAIILKVLPKVLHVVSPCCGLKDIRKIKADPVALYEINGELVVHTKEHVQYRFPLNEFYFGDCKHLKRSGDEVVKKQRMEYDGLHNITKSVESNEKFLCPMAKNEWTCSNLTQLLEHTVTDFWLLYSDATKPPFISSPSSCASRKSPIFLLSKSTFQFCFGTFFSREDLTDGMESIVMVLTSVGEVLISAAKSNVLFEELEARSFVPWEMFKKRIKTIHFIECPHSKHSENHTLLVLEENGMISCIGLKDCIASDVALCTQEWYFGSRVTAAIQFEDFLLGALDTGQLCRVNLKGEFEKKLVFVAKCPRDVVSVQCILSGPNINDLLLLTSHGKLLMCHQPSNGYEIPSDRNYYTIETLAKIQENMESHSKKLDLSLVQLKTICHLHTLGKKNDEHIMSKAILQGLYIKEIEFAVTINIIYQNHLLQRAISQGALVTTIVKISCSTRDNVSLTTFPFSGVPQYEIQISLAQTNYLFPLQIEVGLLVESHLPPLYYSIPSTSISQNQMYISLICDDFDLLFFSQPTPSPPPKYGLSSSSFPSFPSPFFHSLSKRYTSLDIRFSKTSKSASIQVSTYDSEILPRLLALAFMSASLSSDVKSIVTNAEYILFQVSSVYGPIPIEICVEKSLDNDNVSNQGIYLFILRIYCGHAWLLKATVQSLVWRLGKLEGVECCGIV